MDPQDGWRDVEESILVDVDELTHVGVTSCAVIGTSWRMSHARRIKCLIQGQNSIIINVFVLFHSAIPVLYGTRRFNTSANDRTIVHGINDNFNHVRVRQWRCIGVVA